MLATRESKTSGVLSRAHNEKMFGETDIALLQKLNAIGANDEFLLFCTLHIDFCKRIKWEPLFRDKFPLYHDAAQKIEFNRELAYIDLYTHVMYFEYVINLQNVMKIPLKRLDSEFKVAWPLYCWIYDHALEHTVAENGYSTIARLVPFLEPQERRDLLLHARTREMARILFAEESRDGKVLLDAESNGPDDSSTMNEWTCLLHDIAQIASEVHDRFERTERSRVVVFMMNEGIFYDKEELLAISLEGELIPILQSLIENDTKLNTKVLTKVIEFGVDFQKQSILTQFLPDAVKHQKLFLKGFSELKEKNMIEVLRRVDVSTIDERAIAASITSKGFSLALERLFSNIHNKRGVIDTLDVFESVRTLADKSQHSIDTIMLGFLDYFSDAELVRALRLALTLRQNHLAKKIVLVRAKRVRN